MIKWKTVEEERPPHDKPVLVHLNGMVGEARAYYTMDGIFFSASWFHGCQPKHWAKINYPKKQ